MFSTHIASFAFQRVVVRSLLGLFKDKRKKKKINVSKNLFVCGMDVHDGVAEMGPKIAAAAPSKRRWKLPGRSTGYSPNGTFHQR